MSPVRVNDPAEKQKANQGLHVRIHQLMQDTLEK